MKCPQCGGPIESSAVYESRVGSNYKRRRRRCLECRNTFTTYEVFPAFNLYQGRKGSYVAVDLKDIEKIRHQLMLAIEMVSGFIDRTNHLEKLIDENYNSNKGSENCDD